MCWVYHFSGVIQLGLTNIEVPRLQVSWPCLRHFTTYAVKVLCQAVSLRIQHTGFTGDLMTSLACGIVDNRITPTFKEISLSE